MQVKRNNTSRIKNLTNGLAVVFILSSILLLSALSQFLFVQPVDGQRLTTAREAELDDNGEALAPDVSDSPSDSASNSQDSIQQDETSDESEGSSPELPGRITVHEMASDPRFCVQYDRTEKIITVICKSSNLSHIDEILGNPNILKKESDGVWLLNANLSIADGANFDINSSDTKWLKINSTTGRDAYHIEAIGNLNIDSVKITSWNTTSNNYTKSDGKVHRASIAVLPESTGKTNISNSEIGYLGYGASLRQGLSYYGGHGSALMNNSIHDLWYGFYSKGIGNITIEGNHIYSNVKYGLDPHTGAHDMIIRNNVVHGNEGLGIVCSHNCDNIIMEGNNVYGNKLAGIMLSRNVTNSAVRNNTLHDEVKAIVISESHKDSVYNNTISDSTIGIEAKFGSSNNNIHNNTILNAEKYGIQVVKGANENMVRYNNVVEPGKYGICVYNNGTRNMIFENVVMKSAKHGICVYDNSSGNQIKDNFINSATGYGIYVTDADARNNTFTGNQIRMTKVGVSVNNNTDSQFIKNNIGVVEDSEYFIEGNSSIKLENTTFSSDIVRSEEGDQNSISIANSGIVDIRNNIGDKITYDTNNNVTSVMLPDSTSLTLKTIE